MSYNRQGVFLRSYGNLTNRSKLADDLTACDLLSGITGGLRSEIVWGIMDYYRSADYFVCFESLGIKSHPGKSAIAEKRRHISRMIRMPAIVRIIMGACIGERV